MRQLFLAVAMLFSSTGMLSAKLEYDSSTCRFTSSPSSRDIDQGLYHTLVWQCKDLLKKCEHERQAALALNPYLMRSSEYNLYRDLGERTVKEHLQRMAVPTSIRLLADLAAIKFIIPCG